MHHICKFTMLSIALCCSSNVLAKEKETVTFLMGHVVSDNPPFYFLNDIDEISSGVVSDLITAAYPKKKVDLVPLPYQRAKIIALKENFVGCIAPALNKQEGASKFFISKQSFIEYHNKVISMASSKININSINDLIGMQVLAFPGASNYLGKKFAQFSKLSENYQELEHLDTAFTMLFKKRLDVVIMDKQSFIYHANLQGLDYAKNKSKVVMADLFPVTKYSIGCTNQSLVDQFDKAKEAMLESGEYEQILKRNNE